ncbi:carbon-nitrogen hydrolase family protein [Hyperthermus butylicus]|uniref:Amidohydrolase n=1 Tax=Hyperthermus butylicus (strain DSM 5456 / JCM 9403 / PLM1-5) TaxID=415426 RepID=A2BJQ5_HYPBU|nr:carbon-nitrogen hydrolase family protein [Hyperthermus butylicus]ABM80216.1 putative amidohydrolase [Hyperthermus butylicus DSM 5456]
MPITVALTHMKLRPLAKKSNLEKARKLVREAALKGAKLVVLPSFVNIGHFFLHYPRTRSRAITRNQAERIPGNTFEYLSMVALENGVYIIAGPIIERAGPKIFLTTMVISPNGSLIAKYRKVASNGLDEELGISPGKQTVVIDDIGRSIGVMAEDDILYPEIARSLLLEGATALIVTLRPGEDVNRVKLALMARSIENNVPILAVGSVFEAAERVVEIPTMVVDPQNGIVEEVNEPNDTYILVEVMEQPSNIQDIVRTSLMAKALAPIYCKAAKESLVENLAGRLKAGSSGED